MCGIVGVLSFDGARVTPDHLVRLRDTMAHRGPDGCGVWVDDGGRVGFGHRRLSIIDPSPAAGQPMSNADGTLWITYNGEVYNHAELRATLEGEGVGGWRTDHSDTEVVLRAFEHWGISCLDRFRGMFAFGLWDTTRRELWLVRDRLGVKPLYFAQHARRLTFASEIKALLADPDQPRRPDVESMYHYLSFVTTPAPRTLFEGIRKLPAGCWARVSASGETTVQRWWDVWDHTEPLMGVPEQEIAERVLETLRRSVSYRKVSDVPVGVFLSGGVDSSTNVALFSEGEPGPVRTFSIGYEGEHRSYANELVYAERMARTVGAEHHELRLSDHDVIDFLPRMAELQDEPLADPVCVPVYYVSKLARDHGVVVAQVGEGSDELFCGYPFWLRSLQLQAWGARVPGPLKRLGLAAVTALGWRDDFRYEWLRRSSISVPVFWSGAEAFTERQKQHLLSPELRAQLRGLTSWDALTPLFDSFQSRAWDPSALHWMSYSDLSLRLPELLLMRVDKMSMAVGLEARVPFLDHDLVALALSIPTTTKVRGNETKRVLKAAVRGLVPDDLVDRRKQGFGVPVEEFLTGKLGTYARDEIGHFCREAPLLDARATVEVLDSGDATRTWCLLNLALWWRRFMG